jgi:hypothetical protein
VALLLQNGRAPRNPSKRIHSDRKLPLNRTGFEVKGNASYIFMVVTDEYMVQVGFQTTSRRIIRGRAITI